MTFAVVGATGQLGQLTLRALMARGTDPDDVIAIGRNQETLSAIQQEGFRTVAADMNNPKAVEEAIQGVSDLLLISGNEVGRRVQQHSDTIDAAKRAGIRRVVYTSVLAADNAKLMLAPDHRETELYLIDSGLNYTILRNGWYTDNHVPDFDAARVAGVVVNNVAGGRIASATRSDLAEAAAVVLDGSDHHDGQIYELSGDEAWTFDDFVKTASALLGREIQYRQISDEEFIEFLRSNGADTGFANYMAELNKNLRDGLFDLPSADLSTVIGRPTTSLADAMSAWEAK